MRKTVLHPFQGSSEWNCHDFHEIDLIWKKWCNEGTFLFSCNLWKAKERFFNNLAWTLRFSTNIWTKRYSIEHGRMWTWLGHHLGFNSCIFPLIYEVYGGLSGRYIMVKRILTFQTGQNPSVFPPSSSLFLRMESPFSVSRRLAY